jgi:hypothetical protein
MKFPVTGTQLSGEQYCFRRKLKNTVATGPKMVCTVTHIRIHVLVSSDKGRYIYKNRNTSVFLRY